MNAISSLSSNHLLSPSLLAGLLSSKTRSSAGTQSQGGTDAVSLSNAGLDFAKQQNALSDRVNQLASSTADLAQNFLMNFAQQALGDAAGGMQISFDSIGLSAKSSLSGTVAHTQDANGTSDLAALELDDAADFIGHGQITTADGHKYSFEVEVHYESSVKAASASSSQAVSPDANDANDAPANVPPSLPQTSSPLNLNFPGKLKDLFNLLQQGALKLPFRLAPNESDDAGTRAGTLTLRLLDKLDHPNPLVQQLSKTYDTTPSQQGIAAQA
jgi:hypothetical protein